MRDQLSGASLRIVMPKQGRGGHSTRGSHASGGRGRNAGAHDAGRRVAGLTRVARPHPPNIPRQDVNEPEGEDQTEEYLQREMMHRRIFLRKAFGIGVDGVPIPGVEEVNGYPTKSYKCVKSVEQYNQIVTVLKNWGDDDFIHNNPDDPTAIEHLRFRNRNASIGYNYKNHFKLEEVEDADGNLKINLLQSSSGKIVLHMLDVFDSIKDAHRRVGHLKAERTLSELTPVYYSCTLDLCKMWVSHCAVCHTKNEPKVQLKGASKPLISSEFRDRIQVDLIDMRTIRRRDVYGHMQRWIMTVKDHSTGLIYLCALPRKMAKYVAAELEKIFGFIGYPQIFHTGTFHLFSLIIKILFLYPHLTHVMLFVQTMGRSSSRRWSWSC